MPATAKVRDDVGRLFPEGALVVVFRFNVLRNRLLTRKALKNLLLELGQLASFTRQQTGHVVAAVGSDMLSADDRVGCERWIIRGHGLRDGRAHQSKGARVARLLAADRTWLALARRFNAAGDRGRNLRRNLIVHDARSSSRNAPSAGTIRCAVRQFNLFV